MAACRCAGALVGTRERPVARRSGTGCTGCIARTPPVTRRGGRCGSLPSSSVSIFLVIMQPTWGMSTPRSLLASAAVGVWLMSAPAVLGTSGAAADSDHVVGALVACVAVVALAEVGRAVRLLDVPLGAWLVIAPLLVAGGSAAWSATSVAAGALIIALALPRGTVRERYGTLDRLVR